MSFVPSWKARAQRADEHYGGDLGRHRTSADLTDLPIDGHGVIARLWQGIAGAGGMGIEILEVQLSQSPTPARLREAWRSRRAGASRPVILFVPAPEGVLFCGPDGAPPAGCVDRHVNWDFDSWSAVEALRKAKDYLSSAELGERTR